MKKKTETPKHKQPSKKQQHCIVKISLLWPCQYFIFYYISNKTLFISKQTKKRIDQKIIHKNMKKNLLKLVCLNQTSLSLYIYIYLYLCWNTNEKKKYKTKTIWQANIKQAKKTSSAHHQKIICNVPSHLNKVWNVYVLDVKHNMNFVAMGKHAFCLFICSF